MKVSEESPDFLDRGKKTGQISTCPMSNTNKAIFKTDKEQLKETEYNIGTLSNLWKEKKKKIYIRNPSNKTNPFKRDLENKGQKVIRPDPRRTNFYWAPQFLDHCQLREDFQHATQLTHQLLCGEPSYSFHYSGLSPSRTGDKCLDFQNCFSKIREQKAHSSLKESCLRKLSP